MNDLVVPFNCLGKDIGSVGGKNASLGEMIGNLKSVGVDVPDGFATTAFAFERFLQQDNTHTRIRDELDSLDIEDVTALSASGARIRKWITQLPLPPDLQESIKTAYLALGGSSNHELAVAVRSSATAEDLPDASFAGQQETFLNVQGIQPVLTAVRRVFASLYNDRAIAYRVHHGFAHDKVAVSAGIQRMVRSDLASSGVIFTLDTESGFDQVVFITAAYGLGETVVQGAVNPDEFYVHKPALKNNHAAILQRKLGSKLIKMIYSEQDSDKHSVANMDTTAAERGRFCIDDADVLKLGQLALAIEEHYGRAMDIEWAKDGQDGKLYIVQARPETVKSKDKGNVLEQYRLATEGTPLISGRSIGGRIGAGPARIIKGTAEMDRVRPGDVLVTDMTDPYWEPVMKRAAAIVTNRGGRTCHAAIVARELGVPAVVGTGNATSVLTDGQELTVSCAQGDSGYVYAGRLDFKIDRLSIAELPELPFKIMLNVGNPEQAFDFQFLPNAGIGLARLEFIINRTIGIHPKALLNYASLDKPLREQIDQHISGYGDPVDFYVQKLAEGIATLAAAFSPKPVIVRLSDFKSNEYSNLIGGNLYEPHEENPMLGFRGAARYISNEFADCFELECRALRYVREEMGLTNVEIMVPFVRTVDEARRVTEQLQKHGLQRGAHGLRVLMMCEIPANALLADEFLQYFDGFSIGSNDLTQLTLGIDRDSALVADQFDERNAAVRVLLHQAIQACKKAGKYVGICGQGPSDHPDLARWLMDEGIDSVSLNPDSVVSTWVYLGNT